MHLLLLVRYSHNVAKWHNKKEANDSEFRAIFSAALLLLMRRYALIPSYDKNVAVPAVSSSGAPLEPRSAAFSAVMSRFCLQYILTITHEIIIYIPENLYLRK